jgi:hypothetical protein
LREAIDRGSVSKAMEARKVLHQNLALQKHSGPASRQRNDRGKEELLGGKRDLGGQARP